jgi:cell division protein FtsB
MSRIKTIFLRVLHQQYLKYLLVVVVGGILVGFGGDNSIYAHLQNKQRINELQEDIDRHISEYERNQARIHELDANPKAMERIARERYFMKAADEDIFILKSEE